MILQELCKLYDRLKSDPTYEIPKPGYTYQTISFCVFLKEDGSYEIVPFEEPKMMIIPSIGKRTSGLKPNFLADNTKYLFGYGKKTEPLFEYRKEFERRHLSIKAEINCKEFDTLCLFLEKAHSDILQNPHWKKIADRVGVFSILGQNEYLHKIPQIKEYWDRHASDWKHTEKDSTGQCLISGQTSTIEIVHPAIKGMLAGKPELSIVSFNQKAFESYGNNGKQGLNSPISQTNAFKYTTALNFLLQKQYFYSDIKKKDARQEKAKNHFPDTIVFWTGAPAKIEGDITAAFNMGDEAQDDTKLQRIEAFLKNLRNADSPQTALAESGYSDSAEIPFFMLGLSPNAPRLAIRFWHEGTLGKFLENLREHHRAMQMQRRGDKFKDPEFIPLWQILLQTAREKEGIPPLLGGALLRSIIEKLPYPQTLIHLILNRIRVDGQINYVRASVLKAFLVRNFNHKNLTTMLDTTNENIGYLLGRLFAAIEKTQEDKTQEQSGKGAKLKTTIANKYYSSASSTPSIIFPILLNLYRKHIEFLQKSNPGLAVNREKLTQEIFSKITKFPSRLSIEMRSYFAIGYYHQTQVFFAKKEESEPNSIE